MQSYYSYSMMTYGIPSDFLPQRGGGKPPSNPRGQMLALAILFLTISYSKRNSRC